MLEVIYSAQARDDLRGIYQYIAADSPPNALRFVNSIQERCDRIAEMPFAGPARADLRPGVRIVPFRKRVVIAYRVETAAIDILRIFYGGQDYETILAGDES